MNRVHQGYTFKELDTTYTYIDIYIYIYTHAYTYISIELSVRWQKAIVSIETWRPSIFRRYHIDIPVVRIFLTSWKSLI